MNEDGVPIDWPENLDEMLEAWSRSLEPHVGWCLLCNSPIRSEKDFLANSNTHNCEAGRQFEVEHAAPDSVGLRRRKCRGGQPPP